MMVVCIEEKKRATTITTALQEGGTKETIKNACLTRTTASYAMMDDRHLFSGFTLFLKFFLETSFSILPINNSQYNFGIAFYITSLLLFCSSFLFQVLNVLKHFCKMGNC
jgi:hypothetical protein